MAIRSVLTTSTIFSLLFQILIDKQKGVKQWKIWLSPRLTIDIAYYRYPSTKQSPLIAVANYKLENSALELL